MKVKLVTLLLIVSLSSCRREEILCKRVFNPTTDINFSKCVNLDGRNFDQFMKNNFFDNTNYYYVLMNEGKNRCMAKNYFCDDKYLKPIPKVEVEIEVYRQNEWWENYDYDADK